MQNLAMTRKQVVPQRLVVLALVASLFVAGCSSGGSSSTTDAMTTAADPSGAETTVAAATPAETTPAETTSPTSADEAAVAAANAVLALPPAERDHAVAKAGLDLELAVAALSGLERALGGPEATRTALLDAWSPIVSAAASGDGTFPSQTAGATDGSTTSITTPAPARGLRGGFVARIAALTARVPLLAAPRAQADDGPAIGEGMFGGTLLAGLATSGFVDQTNDMPPTNRDYGHPVKVRPEQTVTVTTDSVVFDFTETNTNSKGVTTKLTTKSVVAPCPDASGTFEASGTVDVSARAGNVGQTGTLEVKVTGHVDDDAGLASSDMTYRMQWAKFNGRKGEFVDVSGNLTTNAGGATVNRTAGTPSAQLIKDAGSMGWLYAMAVQRGLEEAAKAGYERGRCVALKPTVTAGPKGMEPSASSSITAPPRSKIDGGPVGGTVKAELTGGATSVSPSGTKVKADATFAYTAPAEVNKTGTVSLEARSKRGIGRAVIEFDTNKNNAYVVVGGLEDFQVNQTVCDIMAPFTLESPGVATMTFTGGLSGAVEASGVFNLHYVGTYSISLPDGPGKPGTMQSSSSGSIAGQAGGGTEKYTLKPTTC